MDEESLLIALSIDDVETMTNVCAAFSTTEIFLNETTPDIPLYGVFPIPLLNAAASTGATACVEALLRAGAAVNCVDGIGNGPIHSAIFSMNIEIMNLLLDYGADVNSSDSTGITPMHLAAKLNFVDGLEWLYAQGAEYVHDSMYRTPLFYAAQYGAIDAFKFFEASFVDSTEADINNSTVLHQAITHLHFDLAHLLLKPELINVQDVKGHTPLHEAAYTGNLDMIQTLLTHGADPTATDTSGQGVLHYLCLSGNPDAIEFFMTQFRPPVNAWSKSRDTPLHFAAAVGNVASVELLLKYGADPTIRNQNGMTPLFVACKHSHTIIAKRLLQMGFSSDTTDSYGHSIFHLIARTRNVELMSFALDGYPGNLYLGDNIGWTPLHYACKRSSLEMVTLLMESGSDPELPDSLHGDTPLTIALGRKARGIHEYLSLCL